MIAYGGNAEAQACKMIKHSKRDIAVPKLGDQTRIPGDPLREIVDLPLFNPRPETAGSHRP
jgi:hypothetical protein